VTYLGCGIRMKASAALVYAKGRFHDAGVSASFPDGATCEDPEVVVCASAGDLIAKSESECSAIKDFSSSLPYINYAQLKGALLPSAGYTLGFDLIKGTGMPSLTSFSEDAAAK